MIKDTQYFVPRFLLSMLAVVLSYNRLLNQTLIEEVNNNDPFLITIFFVILVFILSTILIATYYLSFCLINFVFKGFLLKFIAKFKRVLEDKGNDKKD